VPQTGDNIQGKFYRAWKPKFASTIFPIIPVTALRSLQLGVAGSCLVGPPHARALILNEIDSENECTRSESFRVLRSVAVQYVAFCVEFAACINLNTQLNDMVKLCQYYISTRPEISELKVLNQLHNYVKVQVSNINNHTVGFGTQNACVCWYKYT
jgi:hypothetical protein